MSPRLPVAALLLLVALASSAQQSERFDQYELHYSVLNSTFIDPEVAATYGLKRGQRDGLLNIAVREHRPDGTVVTLPMQVSGRTWDLISEQPLTLTEIREEDAVYYIGSFRFINREWRFFELDFTPAGAERSYSFTFKRQMYIN
jgi:hypothetical protein